MATKVTRQKAEQNLAKAMSHEVRAKALKILNERAASATEIGRELNVDASYHMRRLHELGCIEEVGTRRVRGAIETFYRATVMPIVWTEDWDQIPAERRPHLVGEFTQAILDNVVRSVDAGILGSDGDFWLGPTPLVVDREGLQKLTALHDELVEKSLEIQAEFGERQASGDAGEPLHIISAQACFPVLPPKKT